MEANKAKRVNTPIESLWTAETLLNLAQKRFQETVDQANLLRKKMKAAKKEYKQAKKTVRKAKKRLALAKLTFEKTKTISEKPKGRKRSAAPGAQAKPAAAVPAPELGKKPSASKSTATKAAPKRPRRQRKAAAEIPAQPQPATVPVPSIPSSVPNPPVELRMPGPTGFIVKPADPAPKPIADSVGFSDKPGASASEPTP